MDYSVNVYGDGNPKYNCSTRTGTVKYIVIHYTSDGKPSTANAAKNNCIYFSGGDRQASAHYFIDDDSIWCFADPARWSCWHVGDGCGKYDITNQNSIGIEVVQDGDSPFSDKEIDRIAWLVQMLMAQFSVPAVRVVRHYDASRKACPLYYTPSGSGGNAAWATLRKRITTELEVTQVATLREQIVAKARTQLGVRYWSMHAGPKGSAEEGWGCAMFCAWCLNQVLGTSYVGGTYNFWGEAIGAPKYNQGGSYAFEEIEASEVQPADLVCYFQTSSVGYSSDCKHIALYVGDGKVIGAMGHDEPGDPTYLNIGIKETTVSGQSLGGSIRYIRCKRLEGDTPKSVEPKEAFPTTITVYGDGLNVRDAPSTKTGRIVACYDKGDHIIIDGVVIGDDGYAWGHYIGASSGKDRYVALGSLELAR